MQLRRVLHVGTGTQAKDAISNTLCSKFLSGLPSLFFISVDTLRDILIIDTDLHTVGI